MPELQEINIIEELKKLFDKGFIKTLRENDTGIGYTLETLLKIKENNVGEPDFKFNEIPVELKAQRKYAKSKITLMTKTPYWEPLPAKDIIKMFGYKDKMGRQGLKITLTATEGYNSRGFKLELDRKANRINIVQKGFGVVCYYKIDELMNKLKVKIFKNLLLVLADTEKKDKSEYFRYEKGILLKDLSEEAFEKLFSEGHIVWEFRMHLKENGGVRDHSPGFRINRSKIKELYSEQEVIFDGSEQTKLSEEQK